MRFVALLALLAGLLAACDSQIDPIADGAEDIFSVHGFLDTAADTQYVRITPMQLISGDPLDFTDVAVRTRDLSSGEALDWELDSSADLQDGSRMYRGFFSPIPGRSYRLESGRLPNLATSAITHVPSAPQFELGPLQGSSNYVVQSFSLINRVRAPHDVVIQYTLLPEGYASPITVPVEYGPIGNEVGGNWIISVHYTRDRESLIRRIGLPDALPVTLIEVRADIEVLSEEWPFPHPPIAAGHGHFASVARFALPWRLDRSVLDDVGWIDGQEAGKSE